MSDILFEAFFFCHFIFLIEGYLLYGILWFSVNKNQPQVHPRPLPPEPLFHSLPTPPFWIVHCGMMLADMLWNDLLSSRSHFGLSLAFWLWAGAIRHFPRQLTLRHTCVRNSPGDSIPLRRDRSWAEGEGELHFNCLESFSWSWELWSWYRLQTCPKVGLGAQPLHLQVIQSLNQGCPEEGVWFGWATLFILGQIPQRESANTFEPWAPPRPWGVHPSPRGGGAASPGFHSLLCPSSPFRPQKPPFI